MSICCCVHWTSTRRIESTAPKPTWRRAPSEPEFTASSLSTAPLIGSVRRSHRILTDADDRMRRVWVLAGIGLVTVGWQVVVCGGSGAGGFDCVVGASRGGLGRVRSRSSRTWVSLTAGRSGDSAGRHQRCRCDIGHTRMGGSCVATRRGGQSPLTWAFSGVYQPDPMGARTPICSDRKVPVQVLLVGHRQTIL